MFAWTSASCAASACFAEASSCCCLHCSTSAAADFAASLMSSSNASAVSAASCMRPACASSQAVRARWRHSLSAMPAASKHRSPTPRVARRAPIASSCAPAASAKASARFVTSAWRSWRRASKDASLASQASRRPARSGEVASSSAWLRSCSSCRCVSCTPFVAACSSLLAICDLIVSISRVLALVRSSWCERARASSSCMSLRSAAKVDRISFSTPLTTSGELAPASFCRSCKSAGREPEPSACRSRRIFSTMLTSCPPPRSKVPRAASSCPTTSSLSTRR
mmetsp:Transcript_72652/g.235092  ORF Transcript_72652/g.235092 Transcript_72652/m.235092 type:complete len:282 (-) Transcript_72652:458-1303(-)